MKKLRALFNVKPAMELEPIPYTRKERVAVTASWLLFAVISIGVVGGIAARFLTDEPLNLTAVSLGFGGVCAALTLGNLIMWLGMRTHVANSISQLDDALTRLAEAGHEGAPPSRFDRVADVMMTFFPFMFAAGAAWIFLLSLFSAPEIGGEIAFMAVMLAGCLATFGAGMRASWKQQRLEVRLRRYPPCDQLVGIDP